MERVFNKTVDVLSRVGERIERHLAIRDENDDDLYPGLQRSGSSFMFPSDRSAFYRPLDRKSKKDNIYSSQRDLYGGVRNYSSDNLAASPGYNSFSNYRQNPIRNPYVDGVDRPPYGTGIGGPLNYGYGSNFNGYSNSSSSLPYSSSSGSVGYAPDYYIAERRQVELVPAPPPRIIHQQVPYPVPVDRPVSQPYPVEVPRYVPVDRPVPVPVPSPVPVDRPVPYAVPVLVSSPPPPPVCVPVPYAVPTAVPYYIPVGVPVPSPPPSPVMIEQSVTHTQRWVTNPSGVINQQSYVSSSPMVMNQPSYVASTPAMGVNPYVYYGNGSFVY
jgi:hypothetical protein